MLSSISEILVPTDFSAQSVRTLSFAASIARKWEAKIKIVHIVQTPVEFEKASGDADPRNFATKQAERHMEEVIERLRQDEEEPVPEIRTAILFGNAVSTILELAGSSNYDLIVMGTKGVSGLKKKLFGSITAKVVSKSPIPVLAIPESCNYNGFDAITFVSDYRSGDWKAFKQTLKWAEMFNSDLNVLHVSEKREMESDIRFRGFRELISERTPSKHVEFNHVIQKNLLTGIADYLTDHHVSLLVMVRYPHSHIDSLLNKNHSKQLAYYTKVPLMALPGKEIPALKH